MQIKKEQLDEATERDLLSKTQAEQLWSFLEAQNKHLPATQMTYVLYVLGGIVSIGALLSFIIIGWFWLGNLGIFFLCLVYVSIGITLVGLLVSYKQTVAGSILATIILALIFFAVYSLQRDTNFFSYGYYEEAGISWLIVELVTLAAGIFMMCLYRLPFLFLPVAMMLWYLSIDITLMILKFCGWEIKTVSYSHRILNWELKLQISLWFGLWMIAVAFFIDVKNKSYKDYSLWAYVSGALIFWGAFNFMSTSADNGISFFYCFVNLLMIIIGVLLDRRIFIILGGLGIVFYLGYLSQAVFKGSLLFPFMLTIIGLLVITFAAYWKSHEKQINKLLQKLLPNKLNSTINKKEN